MTRHFLRLSDFSAAEHRALFDRAKALKANRKAKRFELTLTGRTLLLLFEKNSTRTRLSFEAGMAQLGGATVTLSPGDSQISRGESVEDTARVASRYVDAVAFRTFGDDRLEAFAKASSVPVINALSAGGHPIQLLADLLTVEERFGKLEGLQIAFVGDCASNMGLSFIEAARIFGFTLRLGAPAAYRPSAEEIAKGQGQVNAYDDPKAAVEGAHVVVTDVWTSMGQEKEAAKRLADLGAYQLNGPMLKLAKPEAIVLHCLPAHRGEEITADVIDGPQSAVWDEAENRLHVQKALLEKLILG